MTAIASAVVCAMLLLVYGEHLLSDAVARSWAHYIAAGAQSAGFWAALALLLHAAVPRTYRVARATMLGACVWGAIEGLLTAGCGWLEFGSRVHPDQWQGLCGRGAGLPVAACGLTGFAVFLFSLRGARGHEA